MSRIVISADSTCDISTEDIRLFDIRLIPLYITLGERTGRDGVDFTSDDLYDYMEKTGELPRTSAISPEAYKEEFTKYLQEGDAVIHLSLSSHVSSSHQNAFMAAAQMTNVYVIDTLNLSTGSGHLVLMAAKLREAGMPAAEIAAKINETVPKVSTSFVLDTLEYMKKGGRCSSIAAFGANVLKIKPCIEVKGGSLGVRKKYRGNLKNVLVSYAKDMLANPENIRNELVFITHAGTNAENIQVVYDYISSLKFFKEIKITRAGCTISTHCGPNTLGVLFITKN